MGQTGFIGLFSKCVFAALMLFPLSSLGQSTGSQPKSALELYNLVRPQLTGTAAVYILEKIAALKSQGIDRIEISRDEQNTIKTFVRGLESLQVRFLASGRTPASNARVVELNGHDVEYSETDSLDTKWSKLKTALESHRKNEREHHFGRPSAAAEFALEELPTEWMRSPFPFAGAQRRRDADGDLFTLLAFIEIETAKKVATPK